MPEPSDSPLRDPGWYPDPERDHTLRYWDGNCWTDDRAPDLPETPSEESAPPFATSWTDEDGGLTAQARYALGVGLAVVGAVIAIIGVFLPLADTESSLHIAENSLIQHWEGPVVICVALAGLLAALHPRTRPLAFLAGGILVILAVIAGTNLPIEYRNQFSRAVAGNASPGAGIWTVGAGGAILALSALFADWGALSGGGGGTETGPGRSRMARWEEAMSGREILDDRPDEVAAASQEEPASGEVGAPAPRRPKGRRMRRFEELMSGTAIPDPEEAVDPESEQQKGPDH